MALVLALTMVGLASGWNLADRVPYPRPPESFDAVLSHALDVAVYGGVAGTALGILAAAQVGHGGLAVGTRWRRAAGAGLVVLLIWAVVLGSL